MRLPAPRGPLTEYLVDHLAAPPHELAGAPDAAGDPLGGEDLQLALYLLYELHYRSFDEVDDRWEWEHGLIGVRRALERAFEDALLARVPAPDPVPAGALPERLFALAREDDGPSLSRYMSGRGTLEQFRELAIHRSAFQLKEADPHTWTIPRLAGRAKAALVEIQADEYGAGSPEWMHSTLFSRTMEALGLDGRNGAYLDRIPGTTLATVNLMSMFGLHRRWRGASVGSLAMLEITSSEPMARYARGLRRLGYGERATRFYDEHVEADAVHEQLAAHDLAGALAAAEPSVAQDILFGAAALLELEGRFARRLLDAWRRGASSLRTAAPAALVG